jgi:hypothetical protein
MNRPWNAGFGWIIAVICLVCAIVELIAHPAVPNLEDWLILGLAVALVLG